MNKCSMMNHMIEKLRMKLNKMVISEDVNQDELLEVSKALDVLIVQAMNANGKNVISKLNIQGKDRII